MSNPVWEYKTTYGSSDYDMNQLGKAGWELVAAVHPGGASQVEFYWKRRTGMGVRFGA